MITDSIDTPEKLEVILHLLRPALPRGLDFYSHPADGQSCVPHFVEEVGKELADHGLDKDYVYSGGGWHPAVDWLPDIVTVELVPHPDELESGSRCVLHFLLDTLLTPEEVRSKILRGCASFMRTLGENRILPPPERGN